MEETIFKQGDVVFLKSGGQPMTIDKFAWNPLKKESYLDLVECVWFIGKKTPKRNIQNKYVDIKSVIFILNRQCADRLKYQKHNILQIKSVHFV